MNRRSFLARCLSGAVLGMARVLPMPELPQTSKWAQPGDVWYETDWGPVTIEQALRDRYPAETPLQRLLNEKFPRA